MDSQPQKQTAMDGGQTTNEAMLFSKQEEYILHRQMFWEQSMVLKSLKFDNILKKLTATNSKDYFNELNTVCLKSNLGSWHGRAPNTALPMLLQRHH